MVGTYEYDAAGQRTQKTVSGAVTKYHYNGNDLLYTTDASGATLENSILKPDSSIIYISYFRSIRMGGSNYHAMF